MRNFIVVLRGPSAAIFREGTNLPIRSFPTTFGPVNIGYATRLLKQSEDVSAPGQLWVEVQGQGPSLKEIINPFGNAGMAFLAMLSVSANAYVGKIEAELAFDCTPDVEEREYFQQYLAPERGILGPARPIDVPSTIALINAVKINPNRSELGRAANQYRFALDSWHMGQSIEALAHLWMALEALTLVERKVQMERNAVSTTKELAKILGIDIKELDPTIRRDFLLEGDDEGYRKAKRVSDGFEHGFLEYDDLWQLSSAVRDQVAQKVRKSILRLAGLDQEASERLMSQDYVAPMGGHVLAQYLHGTLKGAGNNLAAPGSAYPFIKWDPRIKSMKLNADLAYDVQWEQKLSPQLAEGIQFIPSKFEMWKQT